MFSNDAFRVIESKAVFEDLKLSSKIQFSIDVAQVNTHHAHLYLLVSSNKKNGGISRILASVVWWWYMETWNTPEFQMKWNTTILSVWLTSFKCCICAWAGFKIAVVWKLIFIYVDFILLLSLHERINALLGVFIIKTNISTFNVDRSPISFHDGFALRTL